MSPFICGSTWLRSAPLLRLALVVTPQLRVIPRDGLVGLDDDDDALATHRAHAVADEIIVDRSPITLVHGVTEREHFVEIVDDASVTVDRHALELFVRVATLDHDREAGVAPDVDDLLRLRVGPEGDRTVVA